MTITLALAHRNPGVIGVLLLSLLPTAVTATPDPAPYAAHDQFGQVRLSPDGRHLAVERIDERGHSLLIVSSDDLKPITDLRFPSNEGVYGLRWADSEIVLLSRTIRNGSLETPRLTGEIYAVSVDGSRKEYLYGYRADQSKRNKGRQADQGWAALIDTPREKPGTVLVLARDWEKAGRLHNEPAVVRIDVRSGRREELARVPIANPRVINDAQGRVRFAYGLDAGFLPVSYRYDNDDKTWHKLSARAGELGSIQPLHILPDGSHYLARISERGEPSCLVLMDEASSTEKPLLCEGAFEVGNLMPSSTPGIPLATLSSAGVPSVRLMGGSDDDRALYRSLSTTFAPAIVRFVDFSDDGQRLLFVVEGDREPGRIFLFDRERNHSRLVFARRPALTPEMLAETQPVSMPARDGIELQGFLTLPKASGTRPALVVMPHGGPYGVQDQWYFDDTTQWLAANGHAVLRVNFRGSGGFGLSFERSGYRQWGGRIQDDIIDATRWAIADGRVDGNRVCIIGGSFGAYSALMSSAKAPDLFRCAVGYAGVYDLDSMFKRGDIPDSEAGRAYLDLVIGKDSEQNATFSPTHQVEHIRAAVLLAHGGADWRTPIAHAKDLRRAMKKAGREVEWLEVANEGHGFYRHHNRALYLRTLQTFLARHIGAPGGNDVGANMDSAR